MSNCRDTDSTVSNTPISLRERIAATRAALLQARRNAKPGAKSVRCATEDDFLEGFMTWDRNLTTGETYLVPDLETLWMDAAEMGTGPLPEWRGEPRSGPEAIAMLDALAEWCEQVSAPERSNHQADDVEKPEPSPRMSAKEAGPFCGVSETTWWRQHSMGKTPRPVKIGRRTLWDRDELRAWLAAGCPDRKAWEAMQRVHKRNGQPV